MVISPGFRNRYPNLSAWIERNIPKVKTKPKAWAALLRFGEFSPADATRAITSGNHPVVRWAPLRPKTLGMYLNTNSIYLAKKLCDELENNISDPDAQYMLEAIVLHETVHWGDYRDGKHQTHEAGYAFESNAYGHRYRIKISKRMRLAGYTFMNGPTMKLKKKG
jgi:hypothetical protein